MLNKEDLKPHVFIKWDASRPDIEDEFYSYIVSRDGDNFKDIYVAIEEGQEAADLEGGFVWGDLGSDTIEYAEIITDPPELILKYLPPDDIIRWRLTREE